MRGAIVLVSFVLFQSTANLTICNDTSTFIGKRIKAKFVDYKVSFISKIGLASFELLIETNIDLPFKM